MNARDPRNLIALKLFGEGVLFLACFGSGVMDVDGKFPSEGNRRHG